MELSAYVLIGPTATGKSSLALALAQRFGVDIISADSMNVYQGMDIGTSKPDPKERAGIPHHGMDIRTPSQRCSVGIWRDAVQQSLAARPESEDGRTVIVAGGTGLYINSLLFGLDPVPEVPDTVREKWNHVAALADGLERLQSALRENGPHWFDALKDTDNSRRLQRALELIDIGVEAPPDCWTHRDDGARYTITGLRVEREILNQRIADRAREMFDQGLVDEAAALRSTYPDLSDTAAGAIGYAEAFAVLDGELSLSEGIEKTVVRTRRLAKRQRTWFQNQLSVDWVAVDDASVSDAVARIATQWEARGPATLALPESAG